MMLNKLRIDILKHFIRDYKVKYTGSHIARIDKLNQKSVANALNEFEEQRFLKSKIEGKNKVYSLNLEDREMIINFISTIEHIRTIEFYTKHPLIKDIVSKIKSKRDTIIVIFGSYSKGKEKTESDLDIFIVGKYDNTSIEKLEGLYKLDIKIKDYSHKLFKEPLITKDHLIEEIKKDHIVVKNVQQFVSRLMN